jgi:uncharacterized protein (TIGR01777 family)
LSRKKIINQQSIVYYTWDVKNKTIEENAVLEADYIIHLAGENIFEKRWSTARKKAIIASRVEPVELIKSVLEKYHKKNTAFISASGIGIYGAYSGLKICTEDTEVANDFLGITCKQWEAAADMMRDYTDRVVKIRTGLVLGKNDGFLNKLIPIFKLRLGAALGTGKQFMPWIHVDDLCNIYLEAIENENIEGVYNATVFDSTSNEVFSKRLARLLGYRLFLPNVPVFLLKIIFGERSKIILTGRRVSSVKIQQLGFKFKNIYLKKALEACL